MARSVNTVASGGLPVIDNSGLGVKHLHGVAVSEGPAGFGIAVTKVGAGKNGQPVIYVTPTPGNP
jgi:hypothetical protein